MEGLSLTNERYANLAYEQGENCALAPVDSRGTIRKSIDTGELTILSVLSYPVKDLAGDFVNPDGCDFAIHAKNPDVDVEHSRSPEFGNLTIAKCQHPDGAREIEKMLKAGKTVPDEVFEKAYAVEYRNLTLDDGAKHYLPVAKSYFDRDSRPSMQVFRLIQEDKLPGVSLEFKAISGRPLGPSPLEKRQAYHFDRVEVVKYTHCAMPVNPGSLTITKSLDALIPVVQSGKLGSEAIDPRLLGVLRKSVSRYTPRRILVAGGFVEKKAMDQYDPNASPDTVYDDGADQPDAMDDQGMGGPPTAAAAYEAAQAINDIIDQTEQKLQQSEHIAGKKQILKRLEKLRSEVETLLGIGDQVTEDVGGDSMGKMTADDEPAEVEEDATDPTDDEDEEGEAKKGKGVMKAFHHPKRAWILKSMTVFHKAMVKAARYKRYRKAEHDAAESRPAILKATPAPVEPDPEAELIEAEIAEERARFERSEREKRRKERIYG